MSNFENNKACHEPGCFHQCIFPKKIGGYCQKACVVEGLFGDEQYNKPMIRIHGGCCAPIQMRKRLDARRSQMAAA